MDEILHLAKLCHLIVKPSFTNDSHLGHYTAMTNMELLFKIALSWNQLLAQRLTAELCQGTMPASQGRQCIPPSSLHTRVTAKGSKPKSILQAIPPFNCNPVGSPRNQRFASQSSYTSLQTKVDISIRAQDKPCVSVGLLIVKLLLTFILNTT